MVAHASNPRTLGDRVARPKDHGRPCLKRTNQNRNAPDRWAGGIVQRLPLILRKANR